jgi:hypothetical protein
MFLYSTQLNQQAEQGFLFIIEQQYPNSDDVAFYYNTVACQCEPTYTFEGF